MIYKLHFLHHPHKHSIILCRALYVCLSGFSQATSNSITSSQVINTTQVKDTIQYQKASLSYKFTLNNELLTLKRMNELMQGNPTSMGYYKKAKSTTGIITVLSFAGGFMIGYSLGTMLGGGQPNLGLAAVGCGLLVITLPIASSADKNLLKTVKAYNQDKPLSFKNKYDLFYS